MKINNRFYVIYPLSSYQTTVIHNRPLFSQIASLYCGCMCICARVGLGCEKGERPAAKMPPLPSCCIEPKQSVSYAGAATLADCPPRETRPLQALLSSAKSTMGRLERNFRLMKDPFFPCITTVGANLDRGQAQHFISSQEFQVPLQRRGSSFPVLRPW